MSKRDNLLLLDEMIDWLETIIENNKTSQP
jgi:hypothetical protein